MADQGEFVTSEMADENKVANDALSKEPMSEIHNFVTDEYEKQRQESGDVNIEEDRITNFFARAVSESRRMSREVEKSHKQQLKLYAELGQDTFTKWREEHSAQVLPGHRGEIVSRTEEEMDQF